MNFWENVDAELDYIGMNRKTLAQKAEFDVSNIGKGIKNANVPSADTAVKIASVLGVSVEYLVTGHDKSIPQHIRKKVVSLLNDLNRLSDEDLEHLKYFLKRLNNFPRS